MGKSTWKHLSSAFGLLPPWDTWDQPGYHLPYSVTIPGLLCSFPPYTVCLGSIPHLREDIPQLRGHPTAADAQKGISHLCLTPRARSGDSWPVSQSDETATFPSSGPHPQHIFGKHGEKVEDYASVVLKILQFWYWHFDLLISLFSEDNATELTKRPRKDDTQIRTRGEKHHLAFSDLSRDPNAVVMQCTCRGLLSLLPLFPHSLWGTTINRQYCGKLQQAVWWLLATSFWVRIIPWQFLFQPVRDSRWWLTLCCLLPWCLHGMGERGMG